MDQSTTKYPIDAVITWVDGNDPKHLLKFKAHGVDVSYAKSKDFEKRFTNVEEIKYVVLSILKYASFIRKIFIVTDNQTPAFLNESSLYPQVKIVDHKEIFKNDIEFLPVFNSRSIETKLYEIPGLAEHFIYFNDDMFLINRTKPDDFFIDGIPVIRGKWHKFKENIFYKKFSRNKLKNAASHIIAQEMSAKVLGMKKYFRFHHHPHPMLKSAIANFFQQHPDLERENIRHKFRHKAQFLIQGLSYHLTLLNEANLTKKGYQLIHLTPHNKPLFWVKIGLFLRTKVKSNLFLNLQNIEQCSEKKLKVVLSWFDLKYLNNYPKND